MRVKMASDIIIKPINSHKVEFVAVLAALTFLAIAWMINGLSPGFDGVTSTAMRDVNLETK